MSVSTILAGSASAHQQKRRKVRRVVLTVALLLILPAAFLVVLLGRWPIVAAVESGKSPEYPYLKPQTYAERPEVVFDRAQEAMEGLSGWTITSSDRDEGILHASVVSTLLRFHSEITVSITRENDVTLVNVRSESIGRTREFGDFGQNARNVRHLFRALSQIVEQEAVAAAEPVD